MAMAMRSPSSQMRIALLGGAGVPVVLFGVLVTVYRGHTPAVLHSLAARLPQILTGSARFDSIGGGFALNIGVSVVAMGIALCAGTLLGAGLISSARVVRLASTAIVNLLRNSPWLVLIYATLYLIPFEIDVFGRTVAVSPFIKATLGLALPVLANMAEVFRGGVATVPVGQWDAAHAFGYGRRQALMHVIIPQAIVPMIPNVMNLYAMLMIGTSLIVVTGVADVLSVANIIVATDGADLATALDLLVLLLFFTFCFPIAIGSRMLEQRVRRGA
jgi:polar amino acid transport system permease protein